MDNEYRLSGEQISKLLHDLRAPVSNARGFKSELNEAITELSATIENLGTELSDASRRRLNEIINDDIVACADLLAVSVDRLQDTVKGFDQQFPMKNN